VKKGKNLPVAKAKASAATKRMWQDPAYRLKHRVGMRLAISEPGYHEMMSAAAEKGWKGDDGSRRRAASESMTARNIEWWGDPDYVAWRSELSKLQWEDPDSLIRLSVASDERNEKMSEATVAGWQDPDIRRNRLEGLADYARKHMNAAENVVYRCLCDTFDDIVCQYVPDEDMSPGIYDFYISELDALVEVDGQYWHSLQCVQSKDAEKDDWAVDNDYALLRISESDAMNEDVLYCIVADFVLSIS
jgi:very-short-patch-repair endonuclease